MIFRIETIIGDRHESPDSLTKEQVHQWLGRIQKHDILKVETEDDYWEDIPDDLFELLKTILMLKNMTIQWRKDTCGLM